MRNSETIARLNDNLRTTLGANLGGKVLKTRGIGALDSADQQAIFTMVRTFNAFSEENDPYGEHDFGSVTHNEQTIFWKIDYYDPSMEKGSEDPADPSKTVRVLTVMLSHEY